MRVIGGQYRGRKLSSRLPESVRPTSDRVRESIFDILGSLNQVDDATVADLFCGGGALGIEALSRGAAHVTFVDRDRAALDCVRENLTQLGLSDRATVVEAAVPGWSGMSRPFDLIFCDPPYAFERWDKVLGVLDADCVVIESDREIVVPEHLGVTKTRRYGGTLVTVAHRAER